MFRIDFLIPEKILGETGLLLGAMQLDDHIETFAADLSMWDRKAYLRHWRAATHRFLDDRLFTLICCSRSKESSDLWAFVPEGRDTKVYNSIIKSTDLRFVDSLIDVEGHEDFFRRIKPGQASEWILRN